jgi:hypothetical protein
MHACIYKSNTIINPDEGHSSLRFTALRLYGIPYIYMNYMHMGCLMEFYESFLIIRRKCVSKLSNFATDRVSLTGAKF